MAYEQVEQLLTDLKAWADSTRFGQQKELAKRLGVSPQQLNHWVTGRRVPTLRDGLKLQAFLQTWRRTRKKAIGEEQETTRK
jgi:transcriptional regulator with XRE-family HTH domain